MKGWESGEEEWNSQNPHPLIAQFQRDAAPKNVSARKPAPPADAILAMTFDDARKILSGGDTAATEYFKSKTTAQLTAAFQPFVEKTMSQNGVTQ